MLVLMIEQRVRVPHLAGQAIFTSRSGTTRFELSERSSESIVIVYSPGTRKEEWALPPEHCNLDLTACRSQFPHPAGHLRRNQTGHASYACGVLWKSDRLSVIGEAFLYIKQSLVHRPATCSAFPLPKLIPAQHANSCLLQASYDAGHSRRFRGILHGKIGIIVVRLKY